MSPGKTPNTRNELKYYNVTLAQGSQTTSWPKDGYYFCELCLNSDGHKHLKRDWFVKIEETDKQECCSYKHKRITGGAE